MRRRGRTDANQSEIVKTLRKWGVSVQPLSSVGGGVPDLLCGFRGLNVLLEVKDESAKPSDKRLTPAEADWHIRWRGQVIVVESAQQALDVVIGSRN